MTLPIQFCYLFLSTLIFTAYFLHFGKNQDATTALTGFCFGAILSIVILALERFIKNCNPKTFVFLILGLAIGYLIYDLSFLILSTLLSVFFYEISNFILTLLRLSLLLTSIYISVSLCIRYGQEMTFQIPFLQFSEKSKKEKKIILDLSALEDSRLIDLAFSGVLDNQLILFQGLIEHIEKNQDQPKEKKASETLQKLFLLPQLKLEINKGGYPLQRGWEHTIKIANKLQAKILLSEKEKVVPFEIEGVRLINLNSLTRIFKPSIESGETMDVKVQRVGTEEDQGVGYLEDGTMVVVNGGKGFLGSTVQARVLSVKQAPTGRVMIFCNVVSPSL